MPLDFHATGVGAARARRGTRNRLAGAAAEEAIARVYRDAGHRVLERRWRGRGGEIDLILQDRDGTLVFAEVKKGRDFAGALARISPAQVARIHAAAEEYLGSCPQGLLSDIRFDAALMDGTGRVEIHEGALLAW
ncbi:MAG: hypothetical protein EP318_05585 [Rhodobacteraceae bacterium]|nr:MAG: hypothetical protein EP318_05585 [Paracoccaceae bacterium]